MNPKQLAGERAVDYIEDGMIVGLGSGSTAFYAIQKIGEKVEKGLNITGVCTSENTRELAVRWNIPYADINEVDYIDLTIDGADEVDPLGNGIKGGGGALLFEKIVASVSRQIIWVIEKRKLVDRLGVFPLPVEILPFGYKHSIDAMSKIGLQPKLRRTGKDAFLTDGGHFIVDIQAGEIQNPEELDLNIRKIPGVIEHGLFLNLVNRVVVANEDSVDIITYR